MSECVCCSECPHICGLDYGNPYCEICFPQPESLKGSNNSNNKDEEFMQLALREAQKAFELGEIPVGAILVKDGKIITMAHNTKESENDPTSHAEVIAIREGAKRLRNWRLEGCTLYVTKEPCVMCAGAMINARLGRLVFGCRDERYGAVTSVYTILSDRKLNHEIPFIGGVLEDECSKILRDFFKKLRE